MADSVVWRPHPGPQTEALSRSEREVLYGGARGGGKTEAGIAWLAEPEYFYNPRYRALIIRKNAKDLDDWLFRARLFYNGAVEISGNPPKLKFPKGGMGICGHMADMNAWEDYIGHEYHKQLWEELTLVPQEEQYLRVVGSCRSTVEGLKAQIFATTNPGGPGHSWVKSRFVDVAFKRVYRDPRTGLSRIYIPAKVEDNPTLVEKDPDYIKYLQSLPEPLRSGWYEGRWDTFFGQFFGNLGEHNRERAFDLPYDCQYKLFGSLDHGIAHYTSFGLWYLAPDDTIHRLCSYLANGGTTAGHVAAIWDMIESFRYSHGIFPSEIWYDPSMDTKKKLSDQIYRSDIDEYIDYFHGKEPSRCVRFTPANNRKVDGCHLMRTVFEPLNNKPVMFYFDKFNDGSVERVKSVMTDENNTEIYAKQDGDDAADEWRYGIVGTYTRRSYNVSKKIRDNTWHGNGGLKTIRERVSPLFFGVKK